VAIAINSGLHELGTYSGRVDDSVHVVIMVRFFFSGPPHAHGAASDVLSDDGQSSGVLFQLPDDVLN